MLYKQEFEINDMQCNVKKFNSNYYRMRNFDPIAQTRDKWYDPKRVKNRAKTCNKSSHVFCNFEYEWATQGSKMRTINRPVNSSLPSVDLPLPAEKIVSVNYDSMTEQNLDDWVAQSLNRNLGSMLNQQKKFFLPPNYQQQLKQRYKKNKDIKKGGDNETYFDSSRAQKKVKGYLNNDRKKKLSVNDLCFDYKKLQPHQDLTGTPIKIRQMKKMQKKQIRRRNAVLLSNDVHYARFLKEMQKQKSSSLIESPQQQQISVPTKDMIYSYNMQSMLRKSCFEDVPCSLIERQYERIKQPEKDLLTSHRALINKQQQLHEKYRVQMNEKTNSAINQIKEMANFQKLQPTEPNILASSILNTFKKATTNVHKNTTNISILQSQQKDKKHLQNKVIKLLNDMQVQSEPIDQNMAKLNIHVNQIFLQHPDSRPQTKWILKAQQKIKDNKNLLAIDCYKQAIILQPELFIPVFNIAVLLEKQNMLESSRLWFNLARQFQTDSENVLFGISLVALKQLRFNQSLTGMNQLIQKVESSGKKVPPVYFYIRGLSFKELGLFKQAKQDYNSISSEMKPTNFNVLPNFIFSVVFAKYRRITLQFNCLSYMLFKQTMALVLYEEQKKIKQIDQSLVDIAQKIITNPFFCRFSISLLKKLLKIATYHEKQKGDIIFCSVNTTSIIINGIVSLKSHQNQFKKPEMISVLSRGGIIGAGSLENNISLKPNNWFMALSKVQLITVPKQQFTQFWRGQITFEVDFKYNFLKNVELFKNLPETTLFKLCELLQKKTYEKGAILFNDCSYRVEMISPPGKGYGLAKYSHKADARMIQSSSLQTVSNEPKRKRQKRERSKIYQIIKKHIFKFNQMKFNRTKYPGLFIVVKGTVELQDDRGFRCSGMIGQRDFFGENLFINSDGYHKYGRMVSQTDNLEVYLLSIENMIWAFSQQDKNIMLENCKNRETIQTIHFLRNKFSECQSVKLKYKFNS